MQHHCHFLRHFVYSSQGKLSHGNITWLSQVLCNDACSFLSGHLFAALNSGIDGCEIYYFVQCYVCCRVVDAAVDTVIGRAIVIGTLSIFFNKYNIYTLLQIKILADIFKAIKLCNSQGNEKQFYHDDNKPCST